MSVKKDGQLEICDFVMQVAAKERLIEFKRQILSQQKDFEPYVAFKRITRKSNPHGITAECFRQFFMQNNEQVELADISKLIAHNVTDDPEAIHYKDFLNLVLPKDHSDLRAYVSQKDPYDIEENCALAADTESCLCKLLLKEMQIYNELREEYTNMLNLGLDTREVISYVDAENQKEVNFENLSNLFRNNNLRPYDDELISFLRRVDRNDDGIIDWRELDDFAGLIVAKK